MGSNTFVRADVWTVAQTDQGNVVLIRPKESDLVVPIFIGQLETQAILIGLGRVEMPRPLTHDLFLSSIRSLGADLARVEIRDLKDRTFYANVVLSRPGVDDLVIDARPSDAIALAVRCRADVYIAEDIVESAGVPVEMIREAHSGEPPESERSEAREPHPDLFDDFGASGERQRLQAELEAAVAAEDYERAAALRDRLSGLP